MTAMGPPSEGEDGVALARDMNYNPSLYIRRVFIVYLMAFFKDNPGLGYALYSESGGVGQSYRSLLVTGTHNLTVPDKGHLPSIFVERGPIDSSMLSGAARYLRMGRGERSEIYRTPLSTTAICHCLADSDEEADRLANLARVAIEMDYAYFHRNFGLGVQTSRTDHVQLVQEAPIMYRSSVTVPVVLEVGFDVSPPKGETLREIAIRINDGRRPAPD